MFAKRNARYLSSFLKQRLRRYDWARQLYFYFRIQHLRLTMKGKKFAVDVFPRRSASRIESVSGWYLQAHPADHSLQVWLRDTPLAGLLPVHRHDVAAAFPDLPQAVRSGFMGDVVLPDEIKQGEKFTLSLRAVSVRESFVLAEEELELRDDGSQLKVRNIDFDHIFRDPLTAESISRKSGVMRTTGSAARMIPSVAGVPHFYPEGRPCAIRLSESGTTHPYSLKAQQLIDSSRLVLDFGAGVQTQARLRDHVINLDAIHFPWIDVVNTCHALPFQDAIFDAVISQAVFEHLPNPFFTAQEVLRVLRPGGLALIDAAFMQPFHGDPDHYFNMTRSGLLEIMQGFDIEECGVQPYQNPSLGLIMQIEAVLPFVSSSAWRDRLNHALGLLKANGPSFDACLGDIGRETIAAGVYVLARKPR
jgi:SAM-dependent methyltransferase